MSPRHVILETLQGGYHGGAESRLMIHEGTCGTATNVRREVERVGLIEVCEENDVEVVYGSCDGNCWAAPSATLRHENDASEFVEKRFSRLDELRRVEDFGVMLNDMQRGQGFVDGKSGLLDRLGRLDGSLEHAVWLGAYSNVDQILRGSKSDALQRIEDWKLTGRGGAHFPTALKWRLASGNEGPRYLVVNAEEGEPGVFKDRHLLEGDPHRLLEGILICCFVVGIEKVFIYVNGQARAAFNSLSKAVEQAKAAGLLGPEFLPNGLQVDIELRQGAGGYVCGEESVILNSIEGARPVPRFKPPFATDEGLWGRPTVINNAETLAAVTTLWQDEPPPTKLVSLSGNVARPGVYEVPADGTLSWAGLLLQAGGEPGSTPAILLGGPSGVFVIPERYDEKIKMSEVGAGGLVALAPDSSIRSVVQALTKYNLRESCGECTPCREGTLRLDALLSVDTVDFDKVTSLVEVMSEASLCMLGGMAGRPVLSAIEEFPTIWKGKA